MLRAPGEEDQDAILRMLREFFREVDPDASFFSDQAERVLADLYLRLEEDRGLALLYDAPFSLNSPGEEAAQTQTSGQGRESREPRALLLGRLQERPLLRNARALYVDAAYTRPEYRRRGLMSLMLEQARRWALAHDARILELAVLGDNGPALRFWEQRGFRRDTIVFSRVSGQVFSREEPDGAQE